MPHFILNPGCGKTQKTVYWHATLKHLQRLNDTSLQPKCSQYSLAHLIKALSSKAGGSLSTPTAFLECSPNHIPTPQVLRLCQPHVLSTK